MLSRIRGTNQAFNIFLINKQKREERKEERICFKICMMHFLKIQLSDILVCFRKTKACMSDYHCWLILNEPLPHPPLSLGQSCGPQSISGTDISFIYITCLAKAPRPRANLLKWSLFIQFIKQEYLKGFHLEDLFCLALDGRPKFFG